MFTVLFTGMYVSRNSRRGMCCAARRISNAVFDVRCACVAMLSAAMELPRRTRSCVEF